jgi:hypothetical protein
MKRIAKNIRTILGFADSEFLELLIGVLHTFLLPLAVCFEVGYKWHVVAIAIFGGTFQLYSVGVRSIKLRYYSSMVATFVSVFTALNYATAGLLNAAPSRYGWVVIAFAAIVNQIRVSKEWKVKSLS